MTEERLQREKELLKAADDYASRRHLDDNYTAFIDGAKSTDAAKYHMQKWINAEEILPDFHDEIFNDVSKDVLCINAEEGENASPFIGFYGFKSKRWISDKINSKVTHWAPIPKFP